MSPFIPKDYVDGPGGGTPIWADDLDYIQTQYSEAMGDTSIVQGAVYPAGAAVGTFTIEALQTACDTAAATGQRVSASGALTTSSTLVIKCNAALDGLTLTYTGSGTAVVLGDVTADIFRLSVRLPRVIAGNKVIPGWGSVAGTVGVKAVNLNSCAQIVVPHIQGFETGLLVYGQGNGCAYNTFQMGQLDNNKVNLRIDADATGWSNQNTYIGGRYSHESAEGVTVAGARHVLMIAGLPNPINNNLWLNPSLEGNTAEFILDAAGSANSIISARYEAATPRIRWQDNSVGNLILWGYQSHSIVETFGVNAALNTIISRSLKIAAGSAGAVMILENGTSSANGALAIMAAGARIAGDDPAAAYAGLWTAQLLRLKRSTDTFDRLQFDAQNGRVYFGNGTAALTRYLANFGTSGISISGSNLVFATDNLNDIGAVGSNRPRYVRVGTSVQVGAFATASRPAAATVGAGGMIFDSTLNKPIWSDGAAWRDASGTAV